MITRKIILKQLDSKRINHYIKQTANGNEGAFDKLFVYTYDNMKHIAKFYLKNKSNADDVLVEFYKIILDKVNSFGSISRALRRTLRGTQSCRRAKSITAPRMRLETKVSNLMPLSGSNLSTAPTRARTPSLMMSSTWAKLL